MSETDKLDPKTAALADVVGEIFGHDTPSGTIDAAQDIRRLLLKRGYMIYTLPAQLAMKEQTTWCK